MDSNGEAPDKSAKNIDATMSPKQPRNRLKSQKGGATKASANSESKKAKKQEKSSENGQRRTRRVRTFPSGTFEDALSFAKAILTHAPGGAIRRLTLFDELGRSADSGPSRQLVTNSNAYGMTHGGYQAEHLQLTDDGKIAASSEATVQDQLRARFRLAIENIEPFNAMFAEFSNKKLPSKSVMRDFLLDKNLVDDATVEECIDTFIANAQYLELLQTVAGSERLLTLDHAVEELARKTPPRSERLAEMPVVAGVTVGEGVGTDWDNICFYVSPIGESDSEARRHADLFFGSLVEPAMEAIGLRVIRADQIGDPGMITSQVLEYLKKCRLVIADLSFLNPNVFYEMALRHARRLPVIQLIRKADHLPFDVNQVRSVVIDTSDIYTLVPKLEVIRSEIATQARNALENPENVGNPISVFYPKFFE